MEILRDLDPERVIVARSTRPLALTMAIGTWVGAGLSLLFVPSELAVPRALMLALLGLGALGVYGLSRERPLLAAWLVIGAGWITATVGMWSGGSVLTPAMVGYVVLPILAGLLLGTSAGVALTLVSIASAGLLVLAEWKAWVQPAAGLMNPTSRWLVMSATTALVLWVVLRVRRLVADAVAERMAADARFRQIAEHTADMITVTDAEGRLVYASPNCERILGSAPPLGSAIRDHLRPADRAEVSGARLRLGEPGREAALDVEARYPDGSLHQLRVSARSYRDSEGSLRVVAVARDVTEERALAEQLRQAQKMEAVGQLAGGAAHDFNNLLTVIQGYVELLRSRLPRESVVGESAAQIERAAASASRLTRQMLAFARREPLRAEDVEVELLLRGLLATWRRVLGEGIEVRAVLGEVLPPVHADPNALSQVLLNLVLNARDAMEGSGRLTVSAARCTLPPASDAPGAAGAGPLEGVEIAITDTGCGIEAEELERVFEPFFTSKGVGQGSGLGLSVAYGIVRQSGGELVAESRPGEGSTFRVRMPAGRSAPPPVAREAPEALLGACTVVVVEDDPAVRTFVRQGLETMGCRVLDAASAEAALERVREPGREVDTVLADAGMLGPAAAALARRLREARPGLRVVLMTGWAPEGFEAPEGVVILRKPFRLVDLARAIEAAGDEKEPEGGG